MEELIGNLSNFEVTSHQNNPNKEHPHYALYKSKSTGSSQEERRKHILDKRKSARYDLLLHLRQVEGTKESDSDCEDEEMKVEEQCYARPKKYKNFIMLSEWLVDIPEDFAANYLVLLCPVGKRCLVVADKGRTTVFGRNGRLLTQFPSLLPGGSFKTSKSSSAQVMLDCIYSEVNKTYYILDLVLWGFQSLLECDTIFRFEWLKARIAELNQDISQFSSVNPYRFVRLPYETCSESYLAQMLTSPLPFDVGLDGVLFYHQQTHYTHGPTPLVGWLKPFMLDEILKVPVPDKYIQEKPVKYVNLSSHLSYKKEMRDEKIRKTKEKMEVEETSRDDR